MKSYSQGDHTSPKMLLHEVKIPREIIPLQRCYCMKSYIQDIIPLQRCYCMKSHSLGGHTSLEMLLHKVNIPREIIPLQRCYCMKSYSEEDQTSPEILLHEVIFPGKSYLSRDVTARSHIRTDTTNSYILEESRVYLLSSKLYSCQWIV